MSNPAAPSVMVNCRLRSGQDRQAVAWEAAAYLLMFCGASMCRHTLRHRSPPANARHSLPRPQAAGALRAWACRARTSPWSAPAAAGRCRGPDPAGPRARHGGYSLSFRVISLRQPESSASCSSRGLNTERDDLLPRPSVGRHPGPRPTGAVRPSARRSSPRSSAVSWRSRRIRLACDARCCSSSCWFLRSCKASAPSGTDATARSTTNNSVRPSVIR